MGSPTIFSGRYTKLLTQKGLLQQGGAVNQYDGLRNYIKNSSFESNTDEGWNRVKTTISGNLPTGTPTIGKVIAVAPSISSFGPFSGSAPFDTYALRFGNIISTVVAGEGVISDAFTVDPGDRGKVLTFKLYYQSDAGASTDNWSGVLGSQTWAVYIYDQTAGAWLQPTGFLGMNQNSGVGVVSGTFQSSVVAGQQYRIAVIALRNTTATSALQIDDVYVGPQTAPIGPVVTDWVSYSAQILEGTINRTSEFSQVLSSWRRNGDTLEVQFEVLRNGSASIGGSGNTFITGPNGFFADATVLPAAATGIWFQSPSNTIQGAIQSSNTSTGSAGWFITNVGTVALQYNNTNFAPNVRYAGSFRLKIQGWSSSVQMSNDTDTRVVAFSAFDGGSVNATNTTVLLPFGTTDVDTHAARSLSNTYVIPVSGFYRVSGKSTTRFSVGGTTFNHALLVYKNGVAQNGGDYGNADGNNTANLEFFFMTVNHIFRFNAGDVIDLRYFTNYTAVASTYLKEVSIERISGPSVIAASETVACHVETAAGPTITTGSGSAVSFPTKVYDTHNAFSGNTYTVPVSGKYRITALLTMVNTSGTSVMFSDVYVNGALSKNLTAIYPYLSNLNNHRINGSVTLNLNAGQTVQLFAGSGTAIALFPSAAYNYFIIERVGN